MISASAPKDTVGFELSYGPTRPRELIRAQRASFIAPASAEAPCSLGGRRPALARRAQAASIAHPEMRSTSARRDAVTPIILTMTAMEVMVMEMVTASIMKIGIYHNGI